MKLDKKKALAAKVFNVGKSRILFVEPRLAEIKEAITKEDIKALHQEGAILIKEIKGRKTIAKRKRRLQGNIKVHVNKRKQEYVKLTRKLRAYVVDLQKSKVLSAEEVKNIRKKIKNKDFKSKAQLKDYVQTLRR